MLSTTRVLVASIGALARAHTDSASDSSRVARASKSEERSRLFRLQNEGWGFFRLFVRANEEAMNDGRESRLNAGGDSVRTRGLVTLT